MTKNVLSALALGSALAISVGTAAAYPGQQYQKQAKITLAQARSIALRAFPGKIAAVELEKEAGGSGLRYSFDIRTGAKTHEVGVDAKTGKILENAIEGKNPD